MENVIVNKQNQTENFEIIESQERAHIDTQIATARKYPRSIDKCRDDLLTLACRDREVSKTMFYSYKRGGKIIEGPSVRFAEAVAYSWQNLRVDSYISEVSHNYVAAKAVAHDLERNIAQRAEVRIKILDSNGNRFSEDMIIVTSMRACSTASRNAVFKVVPFALVKSTYEKARLIACGDTTDLTAALLKEISLWKEHDVDESRLLRYLGKKSLDTCTVADLRLLIGTRSAVEEDGMSVSSVLGETEQEKPSAGANEINQKLKEKKQEKTIDKPKQQQPKENPTEQENPSEAEESKLTKEQLELMQEMEEGDEQE